MLVCLSAMSLTNREMSLPVLAALLTIIGYSVNDTIVAYDRVRENRGKGTRKGQTFESQINAAINQTLSRTVLTALTVFFSTAVLYLFGGKVLEDLAFVLTIGVVTGHVLDDLHRGLAHRRLDQLGRGAGAPRQEGHGQSLIRVAYFMVNPQRAQG